MYANLHAIPGKVVRALVVAGRGVSAWALKWWRWRASEGGRNDEAGSDRAHLLLKQSGQTEHTVLSAKC